MSGLKARLLALSMLGASATFGHAGEGVPGGWGANIGYQPLAFGQSPGFGDGFGSYGDRLAAPVMIGVPTRGFAPVPHQSLTINQLAPLSGAFDRQFPSRRRGR